MKSIEKLYENGLLPIISLDNEDAALEIIESILKGGIECLAINYKNNNTFNVIRSIKESYPDILIGVFGIFEIDQLYEAKKSCVNFIITSIIDEKIISASLKEGIDVYPLCVDMHDIYNVRKMGLDHLVVNLQGVSDKISYINSLSYLYKDMKFIIIDEKSDNNLSFYCRSKNIIAISGSWITGNISMNNKSNEELSTKVNSELLSMLDFRLAHIGINCENLEESRKVANSFEYFFGFNQNENPGSIFNDSYIEVLKSPFLGVMGHIAISTNSVERAKAYLERKGLSFNPDTLNYNDESMLQTVYTKEEIGGFAIHLVRRKIEVN